MKYKHNIKNFETENVKIYRNRKTTMGGAFIFVTIIRIQSDNKSVHINSFGWSFLCSPTQTAHAQYLPGWLDNIKFILSSLLMFLPFLTKWKCQIVFSCYFCADFKLPFFQENNIFLTASVVVVQQIGQGNCPSCRLVDFLVSVKNHYDQTYFRFY